jgi:hypothetical protein
VDKARLRDARPDREAVHRRRQRRVFSHHHSTFDRGHGRREIREISCTANVSDLDFPGVTPQTSRGLTPYDPGVSKRRIEPPKRPKDLENCQVLCVTPLQVREGCFEVPAGHW